MSDIIEVRINEAKLEEIVKREADTQLKAALAKLVGHDPPTQPKPARKNALLRATPKPAVVKAQEVKPAASTLAGAQGVDVIAKILSASADGIKAETLKRMAGLGEGGYTYAMKLAAERKLFTKKGERRATMYFPNAKTLAKTNGAAHADTGAN